MLLFFGIVFTILAVACFVLIAFANGMSDSPDGPGVSFWPVVALIVAAVACFVLRHYLHGPISW